ncbi:50S ribosomal protein L14 [bacterium]|jgi:large subunit ribosomal protein L14|nr:50S ribosomal protein L14 [bacterium]NBX78748.1 50S ribosomal protein L14 [bacterium]
MIQKQSYLEVADNSGAKSLQCIHIIGSTRKRYAYLGDRIKCAVKVAIPNGMVKKGDVVEVLIVRTKKEFRREDGSYVRFSENAGIIIKEDKMIGTRVFGPVAREVRTLGYAKVASLAPEIV